MLLLCCEPFVEVLSLDCSVDLFQSLLHAPLLDDCEFVLTSAYSMPEKGPTEQVSSASSASSALHQTNSRDDEDKKNNNEDGRDDDSDNNGTSLHRCV
jgi:hypothetical protein